MTKDYYSVNGLSPLDVMKNGFVTKDEYRGFLIGNVLKYINRFQYKNDALNDLYKCREYLDFLIELENKKDNNK